MTANKKKHNDTAHNPLVVLVKILANALLEDKHGINMSAKNALLILTELVDKRAAQELEKKIVQKNGRYKYD